MTTLRSFYRLANDPSCEKEIAGGLLHELFHVLGVMHTQQRADRDQHIDILPDNIKERFRYEYEVCEECKDHGVPYDCNSIMHAGLETFSVGYPEPTMRSKNNETCQLKWVAPAFAHDGKGATAMDWLLLKRIADKLC